MDHTGKGGMVLIVSLDAWNKKSRYETNIFFAVKQIFLIDCASSDGKERTAGTALPMANIEQLMQRVIPEGKLQDLLQLQAARPRLHGRVCSLRRRRGVRAGQGAAPPRHYAGGLSSFEVLGFHDYVRPMSTYIRRYRGQHYTAAGNNDYACPTHATVPGTVAAPDASRND